MSAEGSLPAETMKKMTKKRDKGGENHHIGGHNRNLSTKLKSLSFIRQFQNESAYSRVDVSINKQAKGTERCTDRGR